MQSTFIDSLKLPRVNIYSPVFCLRSNGGRRARRTLVGFRAPRDSDVTGLTSGSQRLQSDLGQHWTSVFLTTLHALS